MTADASELTKKFARLFEIEGRQVLVYIEPEGDDATVHQITVAPGMGQADVKATGPADAMETIFRNYDERAAGRLIASIDDLVGRATSPTPSKPSRRTDPWESCPT